MIEFSQELRPCKFVVIGKSWEKLQNGLFHCFGSINGEMKGIVENEYGDVWQIKPYCIKFLDSEAKFKEYCFEENPN